MHRIRSTALTFVAVLGALPALAQNREVLAEYRIGVVGRDWSGPVYQAVHVGARDAARDLAEAHSIDVEVVILSPGESTVASQEDAVSELLVLEADGFAISPADPAKLRPLLDFAAEQGVQVVLFETGIEDFPALATITADNVAAGRLAAAAFRDGLGRRDEVAVLTSGQPSPALADRFTGVRAEIPWQRIYGVFTCEPTYGGANKVVARVQADDLDRRIGAWIFLDDWPLRGLPDLPWEAGEMPAVAIQSGATALIYLGREEVATLVTFPYYQWGYDSVRMLVEKLHLDRDPEPRAIISAPVRVDRDNIDEHRQLWQKWSN